MAGPRADIRKPKRYNPKVHQPLNHYVPLFWTQN